MKVINTEIEGVYIIEPRLFRDERGYFFESFSQREFDEKIGHIDFCQDNESMSSFGVMRGLHFQRPLILRVSWYDVLREEYLMLLSISARDLLRMASM